MNLKLVSIAFLILSCRPNDVSHMKSSESQSHLPSLEKSLIDFYSHLENPKGVSPYPTKIDKEGRSIEADIGLIQMTRYLYGFCLASEKRNNQSLGAKAEKIYSFLFGDQSPFIDENKSPYSGYSFKISSKNGDVLDSKKMLYAHSFVILSTARVARGCGRSLQNKRGAALRIATTIFKNLESELHDPVELGYYQEGVDGGYWGNYGALVGDEIDGAKRNHNSHMHYLEALTELYLALGNTSDNSEIKNRVRNRLAEFIYIFEKKLIIEGRQGDFYIGHSFNDQWQRSTRFGKPYEEVNYGHNWELFHLAERALRILEKEGSTSIRFSKDHEPLSFAQARSKFQKMIKTSTLEKGYKKTSSGGAYLHLANEDQSHIDPNLVWWTQMESLLGLWSYGCSLGIDLKTSFIKERMDSITSSLKSSHLAPSGGFYEKANTPGDLLSEWKSAYHDLRALVLTNDFLKKGCGAMDTQP